MNYVSLPDRAFTLTFIRKILVEKFTQPFTNVVTDFCAQPRSVKEIYFSFLSCKRLNVTAFCSSNFLTILVNVHIDPSWPVGEGTPNPRAISSFLFFLPSFLLLLPSPPSFLFLLLPSFLPFPKSLKFFLVHSFGIEHLVLFFKSF